MNKKLMAVAVAGALAAPGLAVAQATFSPAGTSPAPFASSGVQLYGRLDMTIMQNTYSEVRTSTGALTAAELKKGDLFSAGNEMGIRGREDLGGGTSLWFQLSTGVTPDGRTEAGATIGNNWGGRNSALGVTSAIGDINFGVWDSPYNVAYGTSNVINSGPFTPAGVILGNGNTTGALPNARCTNIVSNASGTPVTAANGVCVTESSGNATSFSRRNNNQVQYWSPVFAGLQFKLATAIANYQSPGNQAFASGLPKPKYYSGNITWALGPFSVAAASDLHEGFRPNTTAATTGVANPKDTGLQIGGKWDFGLGVVGVGYEQLKYANNAAAGAVTTAMDVTTMLLNARFNVGPGAVWVAYSATDGGKGCTVGTTAALTTPNVGSAACGAGGEATTTGIGYDYVLSKRTKMYFAYNKIDNGQSAVNSSAYYYVAGPAANSGFGTSGGLVGGTDVTTLGFGIQHLF